MTHASATCAPASCTCIGITFAGVRGPIKGMFFCALSSIQTPRAFSILSQWTSRTWVTTLVLGTALATTLSRTAFLFFCMKRRVDSFTPCSLLPTEGTLCPSTPLCRSGSSLSSASWQSTDLQHWSCTWEPCLINERNEQKERHNTGLGSGMRRMNETQDMLHISSLGNCG